MYENASYRVSARRSLDKTVLGDHSLEELPNDYCDRSHRDRRPDITFATIPSQYLEGSFSSSSST